MPKQTTEVADDITAEQLAWIDEEEKKTKATAKAIVTGEIPQSAINGWDSENWQTKASTPAPDDVDI
jgi:hypothetical protein